MYAETFRSWVEQSNYISQYNISLLKGQLELDCQHMIQDNKPNIEQASDLANLANNQNYFETQTSFSLQCGMHSINNLLRRPAYTKSDMQAICSELSNDFINPHKHVLGGDYDANVLMIALQRAGYQCQWIDKRKQFHIKNYMNEQNSDKQILGFLVNSQMPKKFYHHFFRFSSRHWLAIRPSKNSQDFCICDSNQQRIQFIKTSQSLQNYIKDQLKSQCEVIWVYKIKPQRKQIKIEKN